jgi:phosphatidylglycerophosphate synthase
MLDTTLRRVKDRSLQPLAALAGRLVPAGALTVLSLVLCVGAGVLAATGSRWLALAAWLLGRLFDGLDGPVARRRGTASDLGGYLDMMADTVGYAAVPLGIAAGQGEQSVWMWCAVLVATYSVNTVSWAYLSAIAEKRQQGAAATGEVTTIHMPTGLVEGTETIVLYAVMLAWPAQASVWFAAMAAAVALTIVQRVVWAKGNL